MDILYTIFCFIAALLLLITVPLLFFPTLIRLWQGRVVLPMLGLAFLGVIFSIVSAVGLGNQVFLGVFVLLSCAGTYRAMCNSKQMLDFETSMPSRAEAALWGFVIVFLLPIAMVLLNSAFDTHDEIYSWNYWAVQFFLGESQDIYFTDAPYPALFSHVLGAIYSIFGSADYQSLAKLVLFILPVCVFVLLFRLTIEQGRKSFIFSTLLLLAYVYGLDFQAEFERGLADPMMSAYLLAGMFLLLSVNRIHSNCRPSYLLCAAILVSAAALTKQAAFPWAMLVFPILVWRLKADNISIYNKIVAALLPLVTTVVWIFTAQGDFTNNKGVVTTSFADRNVTEQLIYAFDRHFIQEPISLALLVLFLIAIVRFPSVDKTILAVALLISTSLWLLFGAYEFRLGMHIFLLGWLFVYSTSKDQIELNVPQQSKPGKYGISFLVVLTVLSIAHAGERAVSTSKDYGKESLLNGYGMQSYKLVGEIGKLFLMNNIETNSSVWVNSNYLYGFLYNKTNVQKPWKFTDDDVIQAKIFLENKYEFLLFSTDSHAYGPGGAVVKEIIRTQPNLYKKVFSTTQGIGLEVYKRTKH